MKYQKKSSSDLITVILKFFAIFLGVISFIASSIVMKLTPYVVGVLIILDLCAVVNFGIMTILMYGVLTFIAAMVLFFVVSVLTVVLTRK